MPVTPPTADDPDDDPGGIPLAPPARPPGPRPVTPTPAAADLGRDDLDDGEVDQGDAVGAPRQRIDGATARPVPAGENTLLGRADAEEESRYAALLATLDPAPPVWARWVGSAGVVWLVVLGGVVLALFVLA
ncbi:MAG: hypothetical protein JWO38_1068, partial [Gemmataceae bacterium]|nr:hypothetical protein [Gemmataceae bacterium]